MSEHKPCKYLVITPIRVCSKYSIEGKRIAQCTFGIDGNTCNDYEPIGQENRWGVVLEIFQGETVPRKSLHCPCCGKTYYAWSDVENYCTRCGEKVEGREDALSNYFNGIIGNYEQDKKIMKERYGVEL